MKINSMFFYYRKYYVIIFFLLQNIVYCSASLAGLDTDSAGTNKVDTVRRAFACVENGTSREVQEIACFLHRFGTDRIGCCETVLHIAARDGHLAILRYLVEILGADIYAEKCSGEIPFHDAIENGHINIVRYFVEICHVEIDFQGIFHKTCLHFVRDIDIARYLVAHGAAANSRTKEGKTPLHLAVEHEALSVVKYLVEACGADPLALDLRSCSPLKIAAENRNREIIQYFFTWGSNVNKGFQKSLLNHANWKLVDLKHLIVVGLLDINVRVDDSERTLLHVAVHSHYVSYVKFLIRHGADIEARDADGKTALSIAIDCYCSIGWYTDYEDIIRTLIRNYANVGCSEEERLRFFFPPLYRLWILLNILDKKLPRDLCRLLSEFDNPFPDED